MSASEYSEQIIRGNSVWPPRLHVVRKNAEIAPIRNQGDSFSIHSSAGNAVNNARGQPNEPMCRAVTEPFQSRHSPQHERILNNAHGFWKFRPKVSDFKNKPLAAQPSCKYTRNAGSQRRSRGEDDIIGFIQCEAYASNGVFEEYPRASNKPIAVGIGEIKFNNVDPIDSSPP